MQFPELEQSTKIILKIIFVLLTLAFLWFVRDIIILLLLAVILASAMEPLVDYLKLRRVPRAVTVLAVYIAVFALIGVILSLIIPPVISQFNLVQQNLPEYSQQLSEKFPSIRLFIGSADLRSVITQVLNQTGGGSLFARTLGVFNGVVSGVTILVISFYLVAEERGMKKFIHSLVPSKHQDFTINLVDKIQHKMGLWLLGQIILSFFIFILTFIGLTLLGIHYALFLALLAGLLEVVPYIGPIISAMPALFFALVQNPPLAIGVLILYILVQKTEGYVLVPKIYEKTIGTSPLVVLLAVLIGFKLAGILGLLLAVPLVAAMTVVISELWIRQDNT
jgi:predicted PurR-regulated permease PerM